MLFLFLPSWQPLMVTFHKSDRLNVTVGWSQVWGQLKYVEPKITNSLELFLLWCLWNSFISTEEMLSQWTPFCRWLGWKVEDKNRFFENLLKNKHVDLAGWKLRCLTGIHAGPRIFVSVLSNVQNFISQWMFLYVKRWEGKSVKNWCPWVFCEEARLGREKERSKVLRQLKALITQLSSCWNSKTPTCFSLRWPSSNRRANHRESK